MIKYIDEFLSEYKEKKLIVSVSGGVDSLVLFFILYKLKYDLVMVHFNHQKREESLVEANYLKELTTKLNIPFEYFILNIDNDFQNEAHHLRKKHLTEVAFKYKTNVIITGHHLNDLMETILIKIARGSNLLGYSGMSEYYYKDGFYYLKPLLRFSKEELIAFAKKENIKFFQDESNLSDDYLRNKLRNNVVLQTDFPLDKVMQYSKMLNDAFVYIRKESLSFLNNKLSFNIKEFDKLDNIIKFDIISYLLEKENVEINQNKLLSIVNFIKESGPNARYTLSSSKQFVKEYEILSITEIKKENSFNFKLDLNGFNVLPNKVFIDFNSKLSSGYSLEIELCYNINALPLYARTRKEGDLLYFPFGHKKLKDFYIDKKIPLKERNSDIIITDKNDEILAVLGKYINSKKFDSSIKLKYGRWSMDKDIKEVLLTHEEILKISKRLGEEVTEDYKNSPNKPILLGLLKGCVPFMSYLMNFIDLYLEVEFMDVSSYNGGIRSSGDIKIRKDVNISVFNRDIIIVEDIVDTGKTLDTVIKLLKHRGAKTVEVVTLLDKPEGRVVPFEPKYVGYTIPKVFVVGFGLDYDEYYRNLPYIGVLKESVYKK